MLPITTYSTWFSNINFKHTEKTFFLKSLHLYHSTYIYQNEKANISKTRIKLNPKIIRTQFSSRENRSS